MERFITKNTKLLFQKVQEWSIDKDEFFVLDDNHPNSFDSDVLGPVHSTFIVGVVTIK